MYAFSLIPYVYRGRYRILLISFRNIEQVVDVTSKTLRLMMSDVMDQLSSKPMTGFMPYTLEDCHGTWKRKINFQTIIFRFYVNFRGCIPDFFPLQIKVFFVRWETFLMSNCLMKYEIIMLTTFPKGIRRWSTGCPGCSILHTSPTGEIWNLKTNLSTSRFFKIKSTYNFTSFKVDTSENSPQSHPKKKPWLV